MEEVRPYIQPRFRVRSAGPAGSPAARHGCQVLGGDSKTATVSQWFEHDAPNVLSQMGFKERFILMDARHGRCRPLTLLGCHSRYALCIQACG